MTSVHGAFRTSRLQSLAGPAFDPDLFSMVVAEFLDGAQTWLKTTARFDIFNLDITALSDKKEKNVKRHFCFFNFFVKFVAIFTGFDENFCEFIEPFRINIQHDFVSKLVS